MINTAGFHHSQKAISSLEGGSASAHGFYRKIILS